MLGIQDVKIICNNVTVCYYIFYMHYSNDVRSMGLLCDARNANAMLRSSDPSTVYNALRMNRHVYGTNSNSVHQERSCGFFSPFVFFFASFNFSTTSQQEKKKKQQQGESPMLSKSIKCIS